MVQEADAEHNARYEDFYGFYEDLTPEQQNAFTNALQEALKQDADRGEVFATAFLDAVGEIEEEAQKNTAEEGGVQYSISETTDGRFVAVVDDDILSNIDTSSWDKAKKDAAKKAASDALKQFSDGIVVDGITRKVNKISRREYTRSNYTESLYSHAPDVFADKMRAAEVANDIVVAATNWSRDGGVKHARNDDFVDFDHGRTLIVSGDAKYSAEVVVGITDKGDAVFYDVVDMTPTEFDIIKEESPTTATTHNAIGDIQGDSLNNTVTQDGAGVKKYSLSDDLGPVGPFATPASDLRLMEAPIREDIGAVSGEMEVSDGWRMLKRAGSIS